MAYHTQVPNLVIDFVMPLLSEAEHKCYEFIIRRTLGFVVPAKNGPAKRKTRDHIAMSQFESGMTSGPWTFNLGTMLAPNSIRKALQSLQEKGLIQAFWTCQTCSYEKLADAASGGRQVKCPACKSNCQREFSPIPLTARRMVDFLNANDPLKRSWSFDREVQRFRATSAAEQQEREGNEQDMAVFVAHLRYPDLVAQAIERNESSLGRKLTPRQKIEGYYKPVIAMQKQASDHPQVVVDALKSVIKSGKGIIGQEHYSEASGKTTMRMSQKPLAYAQAIVRSELATRRKGARQRARQGGFDPMVESMLNQKLEQARALNRQADKSNDSEARAESRLILSEMLGHRQDFAKMLFSLGYDKDDAKKRAGALIRWAFKIGETDVVAARQNQMAVRDWYPDWEWPEDLPDQPRLRSSED